MWCFDVIQEEFMEIGNAKHLEDLWRFWKDHEWWYKRPQKTLPSEELCSQDILYGRKHLKRRRNKPLRV